MVKDPRPERDETDRSLAVERANADRALGERAAAQRKTDDVIARVREEADQVLAEARDQADERLNVDAPAQAEATVAAEREVEDDVLRAERAVTDRVLDQERAASLARFFPLERDNTDLDLSTERARADDALAHRDDFLGMVTHDLRDLLSSIVISASAIAQEATHHPDGAVALQGAQRINRAAGRMNRLIGDLVDVASIDAGKLAVVPAPADGAALVREAVDTWTAPSATKSIKLVVAPPSGDPAVMLDHERILQVLANLITNAAKFSPRGSCITCGVEQVADGLRFYVRDEGVGIPGDKLERIFERFWQIGRNDRRGLGLGLYISRCIVEAHGGRIWAESTPAVGSTFFFTLPR